ncbi:hypothetical protein [Marispirochaeta sp.]|nr:hypothetical protein [Marispirochaeta sp.]
MVEYLLQREAERRPVKNAKYALRLLCEFSSSITGVNDAQDFAS